MQNFAKLIENVLVNQIFTLHTSYMKNKNGVKKCYETLENSETLRSMELRNLQKKKFYFV